MDYVAGIDIGTSSCKTVLVDDVGVVVGSATQTYFSDGAEIDPMVWWRAAVSTLKEVCEKKSIHPHDIVAVGTSGQMQGCTFLGKDGKPVRPSMLWYGTEPTEQSSRLNENYGELFLKNCLMPSLPSLTGSKARWVMEHEPEAWEKTDKILFAPCFITYMLTGKPVADNSDLGLSGLNSVTENNWSKELLEVTGIDESKLPELLQSTDIAGTVNERAAAETGLKEGTVVIAGCGDGPGECYSVNIADRPEMKLRLGSAGAVNVVIPKEWYGTKVSNVSPYVDNDHYMAGNYISSCAMSVKWARGVFFNELPKEDESYILMDYEAAKSEPGAGGLMFHPYLNGEAAHYRNPLMRAKFTGGHISNVRGDFLRAVYEGVSFGLRDMIEHDDALKEMKEVVLCGGGTKSKLWMKILSSALGKNGVIPKSADASYGVALMAGQAVGLLDAAKAADKSRSDGKQVEYDPVLAEKYDALYGKYLSLVNS